MRRIIYLLNFIGKPLYAILFYFALILLKIHHYRPRLPSPFIILPLFGLALYLWILKDLPSPRELSNSTPKLTTQILDRQGRLLYKIFNEEKRTLVQFSDIPLYLKQATIAIEDKTFYQHQGFSLTGIVRAIERNLTTHSTQGGSTITQQLIKNTLLNHQKTFQRKIKEIILSIHTELIFTKDQILTMYLNQVNYGGPAYGIQEAAQQYFGKNVSQLTLAESALLAGLPQAPTKYSPYGAHPELAKERQLQVLDRMIEDGYISESQAQSATRETLIFLPPQSSIQAPHFIMYLKDLLVDQLGEKTVEEGGLQIQTTLDLDFQQLAHSILNQELQKLVPLNVTNGAVLITRPQTGEILAMVGSRDYFDTKNDGQVNLTTRLRQPGSAIKPITYALAFLKGYRHDSLILDAPISFKLENGEIWTPKNYDGRFHGSITLRIALASSYNVPAIRLLTQLGIDNLVDLARKLGITTWNDPSRFGLALTLGSLEVKLTDLAQVYGAFANQGLSTPTTPLLAITDSFGRPIKLLSCPPTCPSTPVLSPEIAQLITDILSDNSARAPAFGLNSVLNLKGNKVAVKTGTSNELRDNWTIGYTSEYLVAVWVGNNDNSPMSRIASGITGTSPIWAKIMTQLLSR